MYPTPYPAYRRAPQNGYGEVALIVGLPALLIAWIPVVGVLAWPFAIAGTVCGFRGLNRVTTGRADNPGIAWSGLLCSLAALTVCILYALVFVVAAIAA